MNYFLMDNNVVSLVKCTYLGCKRMNVAGDKTAIDNYVGSLAKGKETYVLAYNGERHHSIKGNYIFF